MKILLFSDFGLPDSCANATRVFAFAKILIKCGYDVQVLGVSYRSDEQLNGVYDGISYQMLRAPNLYGVKSIIRVKKINEEIKKYLLKFQTNNKIDAIFLSNIYYDYSSLFLKFSKKYDVKLIVNVVEWYDSSNEIFDGLLGKIKLLKNRIALKVIFPKMRNIIAISELLGNYYKSKNCNVCVIPTILDIKEYESVKHIKNKKMIVSYAGSPARKDYIVNVIRALLKLDDIERKKMVLNLYGVTVEDIKNLGITENEIYKLIDVMFIHGRIPHNEVKNKIASSDFTILLRPNLRYANAGFPTKVGESMACGTPIIANLTSDIGKYVIDGRTGIICENESVEACVSALRKALYIFDNNEELRCDVKKMAYKSFDYNRYVDVIKKMVEES